MLSAIRIIMGVNLLWAAGANSKTRDVRYLQASSNWVVDYADNSCALGRNFGDGKQKVTLFMEQLEPGDWFRVMIVGDSVNVDGTDLKATIRFGPAEIDQDIEAAAGTTRNKPTIFIDQGLRIAPLTESENAARKEAFARKMRYDASPLGRQREGAVTWIQLGKLLPFDLVLETGAMDEPLAALRTCSWDMVRSWGLDVEQQKHLTKKPYPKQPVYTWFSDNDYPMKMLIGGYQSNVNFAVLVDETGKPTSCIIQSSTRPKEFDEVVCESVMRHARFEPALDAQGKPVRSFSISTVKFRIGS